MENRKLADDSFWFFADPYLRESLRPTVGLHTPVVADTALPVVESFVDFDLHYVGIIWKVPVLESFVDFIYITCEEF